MSEHESLVWRTDSAEMQAVAYWTPKEGTSTSEWEDGVAYSNASGWFCVTDGASTGGSSREWAFALAESFVDTKPAGVFASDQSGADCFATWRQSVRDHFDPMSSDYRPSRMPEWVQKVGAQEGAHATLLGGHLERGRLRMVAVGDCCAFHVGSAGLRTFPLVTTTEFGSHPDLVSSVDSNGSTVEPRRLETSFDDGDRLVVASDALSEWLMKNGEDGAAWRTVMSVNHVGFEELCRDLRADGAMKNDDVTMLRCTLSRTEQR
jgi:hypothetical protein